MRRTASEILRGLENRVARLERQSNRTASEFDPRKAVVFFDLGNEGGISHSNKDAKKAVSNIERMLNVRVGNKGDGSRESDYMFKLDSLDHAENLMYLISKKAVTGHDTLITGSGGFLALNFRFYPKGLSGNSYTIDGEGVSDGDLFSFLEDQGTI